MISIELKPKQIINVSIYHEKKNVYLFCFAFLSLDVEVFR